MSWDRFEPTEPPRPRPPKKNRTLLIVLLVAAVPVVLIMLCAGAWLLVEITSKDQPVTAADRELLITGQQVGATVPGFRFRKDKETVTKKKLFDGSIELFYEYDDDNLWVTCTVSVETQVSDAKVAYSAAVAGNNLGVSFQGTLDNRSAEFRWGDELRYAVVKSEKGTLGHVLTVRKGKVVYDLVIVGIYFDNTETFRQFVTPKLNKISTYQP